MSYFGFLLRFLVIPLALLLALILLQRRRVGPAHQRAPLLFQRRAWVAVLLHALIAVLYTTPWDNYLVATGVWWYDPDKVTGVTLGWVPLEEYTFFVLQTALAGAWLLLIAHRSLSGKVALLPRTRLRQWAPLSLALLWLGAAAALVTGWRPATYTGLTLIWALPPIGLQLAFGADILWRLRRAVLGAILSLTLYLSLADSLAIDGGTWTINPDKSSGLLLGGVLPAEELLFFFLTNTLVVFGVALLLEPHSHARMARYRQRWSASRPFGLGPREREEVPAER